MVPKEVVKKVAYLSRLRFSGEEEENFISEFSNTVSFVEMINELDTSEVEPSPYPIDIPNIPREDEHKPFPYNEELKNNFPQRKDNFIVVPKVVEK
jgi:aspartyl-tRNA(Asn)/glutamyl-tRNA(Gln) amidotransferase subunit C